MNESETPIKDISIDRVANALECWFVDCDRFWTQQIPARLNELSDRGSVSWTTCDSENLRGQVPADVVVMQVSGPPTREKLSEIFRLSQAGVSVMVVSPWHGQYLVGDREHYSVLFRASGAVAVVTGMTGCDKLIDAIRKLAERKSPILTHWRTRFEKRLPWQVL